MRISDWSSDVCSSDLRLGLRQQAAAEQQGHCDPGPGELLGQLAAYVASTDLQQVCWQAFEFEGLRAGQVGNAAKPRDRWHGGARSGGNNDLPGLKPLTVESDSALVQLSLAFQISDAVVGGQQIDVLALPQGADQFVLLPTQCVPVGEAPAPFDAGEAARDRKSTRLNSS